MLTPAFATGPSPDMLAREAEAEGLAEAAVVGGDRGSHDHCRYAGG